MIALRRAAAPLALALASLASAQPTEPVAGPPPDAWSLRLSGPRARADLRHPDPAVRIEAARTLGRSGEPHRAVAALADALAIEEDARVRSALFRALARRGDPAVVPRLAAQLGDLGRDERAEALATIAAIGGESAIRVLVEWLAAPDVGDAAAAGLVRIGPAAVPHLLRALRLPAGAERAARALGAIGDARATPALVLALESGPPSTRIGAIEALAVLGDERAAPALARALRDPVPAVVEAALAALPRVAGPELGPTVAAIADRGRPEHRGPALRALVRLDPDSAAPRVEALLASETAPPAERRSVLQAIVDHPAPALVPALAAAARREEDRDRAADALARVANGAGIEALIELGEPARFALASAVRRHEAVLGAATIARARAALGDGSTLESALLLALARDGRALAPLSSALRAGEPQARAQAALGLALLGPLARPAADAIAAQLAVEEDARAFRALAGAASALGVRIDPARIDPRWWSEETAPELLWLAAGSLESASPRERRRVGRAMRRALRAVDPRERTGAALALARARETTAWRALAAALDDEHDAVRFAVARALASLDVNAAREAIAARERVEPNERVWRALRAALAGGRPPPARLAGSEVLLVRIVTAPGLCTAGEAACAGGAIDVDVLLPDGRWLRTFALPGGEVIVPDLPAGEAEVQVRI